MRAVVHIGLDKATLLLRRRVARSVADVGADRVVVVVSPLGKMVRKFEAWEVGGGVLEVDHDQLFVFVCGLQQRGFWFVGSDAKDVAVLCLRGEVQSLAGSRRVTRREEQPYIVVGENELVTYRFRIAVLGFEVPAVLFYKSLEDGPLHAADEASRFPHVS